MKLFEIPEERAGLRGGVYHFVIENGKLIHISKYAKEVERSKEFDHYYVDLEELRGKTVVRFLSSRSGPLGFWKYPAEDLALEWNERCEEKVSTEELKTFELAHLTYHERLFLREWEDFYKPMLKFIVKFERKHNTRIHVAPLLNFHLRNDIPFPISFIIPYGKRARQKSLEGLTKHVHQVWVALKLLDYFGFEPAYIFTDGAKSLSFEQGSLWSVAKLKGTPYSLWYEFDVNPHTMCSGMLWRRRISESPRLREFYERFERVVGPIPVLARRSPKRAPTRPDIIIMKAKNCDEIFRLGIQVEVLIECKDRDYTYWEGDIKNQIIPLQKDFRTKAHGRSLR